MKNNFRISHTKENYTNSILFHSHDFFEVYFFLAGNVTYYIENEVYTLEKGDILVIPPGKLHRPVLKEDKPYERCVLWLYSHFLYNCEGVNRMVENITNMIAVKNTRRIHFEGEELRVMRRLFDNLLKDFQSHDELTRYTSESEIVLILKGILDHLQNTEKATEEQSDVVRQVISYLNANIVHAPSLEELADVFFVSKYYLSHKFKEHTRMTIHQYILMKKINLAKELLEKGISPQKVSELCGFSTYSNFYKVFIRQAGISPKEYKGKIK